MTKFYTFSWIVHIFIIFILGICILSQTWTIFLNFFRHKIKENRYFKVSFEILILIEILIFSLLYGQMLNGYKNGFLVPRGYLKLRIIIFTVILIMALLILIYKRNFFTFAILPVIFISLPIIENNSKDIYPYLFIGALIFFFIRSIKESLDNIDGIKSEITAFSIPHGLNSLYTGVLFSDSDGHIIFINHQMYNLMFALTGKIYRNSQDFHKELSSGKYKSRYEKAELDGETVYILEDGSGWIFKDADIFVGNKKYIHLSATDVSEIWELTVKLQDQEEKLKEKSEDLKKTLSNLNALSKKEEIERAEMRVHDILGERISVLLRIIQNEKEIDIDLLKSLSKGLLAELKLEDNEIKPYDELKRIQKIFNDVGIEIKFQGVLPIDDEEASLFIDIIREASTNAVRHGLATEIDIKSELNENEYRLTIKNNGRRPIATIVPGNGIKTMIKKVSLLGGRLEIDTDKEFRLIIVLPGGGKSV